MNREYEESEIVLEMDTRKIIASMVVIAMTLMAAAFFLGMVVGNTEPMKFQPTPEDEPMTSGQIIWRDLQRLGEKITPR